jgi:hypothetical protein
MPFSVFRSVNRVKKNMSSWLMVWMVEKQDFGSQARSNGWLKNRIFSP